MKFLFRMQDHRKNPSRRSRKRPKNNPKSLAPSGGRHGPQCPAVLHRWNQLRIVPEEDPSAAIVWSDPSLHVSKGVGSRRDERDDVLQIAVAAE